MKYVPKTQKPLKTSPLMLAIACLSLYSVPAQSAQKVEYGRGTSGTTCSIDSNGNCTSLPESTSLQIFNSKNHIGPSNLASKAGDATNNEIIYASESINGSVWGARSNSDDVSLNNVTIQSGNIGEFVYGAYTDGSGKIATQNTINLTGGTIGYSVYGGYSKNGSAENNSVLMQAGDITNYSVYAGYVDSGNGSVQLNKVTITGGNLHGTNSGVYGGYSSSGLVKDNTVEFGTAGTPNAAGAPTVAGVLFGGYAAESGGQATSNTVTMHNGQVKRIYAGQVQKGSGNATGNKVYLHGGYVTESIHGGATFDVFDPPASGAASKNLVEITGGKVGGNIFGGESNTGNATNNTVVIRNAPVFNDDAASGTVIFGGKAVSSTADVRSGNVLQLHSTGIRANDVKNFEHIQFYLPNSAKHDDTVLTLSNNAGADITNTRIGVGIQGGSSALRPNDRINLVRAENGSLATDNGNLTNDTSGMHFTATQGIALNYRFMLKTDPYTLYAQVEQIGVTPQNKSLLESQAGTTAFINQGADLIAEHGIQQALLETQLGKNIFAIASGGKSRYKTGSHVDVQGANIVSGFSAAIPNTAGKMVLGAFAEAGFGSYDSFNSFSQASNITANGSTRYYGAGMLGHQEFANGMYIDGSLRAGRVESSYRSTDLENALGHSTSFDSNRTYYSAHMGLGKTLKVSQQGSLDMYTKLFYTRQNADNITIFGDPFTFDAITSRRARLGLRYSHKTSDTMQIYAGLAFEREFNGKAKGSVHGLQMDAPSLKGNTGILDVGVRLKPLPTRQPNLSVDIGAQGYAGKRQGGSATLRMRYEF